MVYSEKLLNIIALMKSEDYHTKKLMGKFKKNVTVQFFYPHALNMEYFYLNLSLKGVC